MTILIYRYGNICEPDIIRTFQEFGTQVEEICEEITEKKMTASRRVELVHNAIENCRPAMVFSINFFPAIAEVCHSRPVVLLLDGGCTGAGAVFTGDYIRYEPDLPLRPVPVSGIPGISAGLYISSAAGSSGGAF